MVNGKWKMENGKEIGLRRLALTRTLSIYHFPFSIPARSAG
jgi:hypothetical protein